MPSPIIYDSASGDRVSRQIRAADSAFASGAVQSGALGDSSVNSVNITDGAVASGEIASGSVGSVHLADNAVASGDIAAGAVASGQVASGSIGSVHLADSAVASGDIAAGAVASGQIASGQVGSVHLASGTLVVSSGQITAGSVASGQIASGSVGSVHLADNAVASGDIAAGAVASGQIASGQVGSVHLASGTTVAQARFLVDDVEYATAEPISGTQPVAINASGNAVLANAISGRMPAIGIAGANTASGATISLHHEGQFNSTLFRSGNMVGGRRMFVNLSGDISTTPPTASGSFSQVMGVAKSASGGFFKPEMEILQVT